MQICNINVEMFERARLGIYINLERRDINNEHKLGPLCMCSVGEQFFIPF